MKRTFWYQIMLVFVLMGCLENAYAVPAPRKITSITQPDGTVLDVWLKGDEFFHYALSTDGYVLISDEKGFYNYAVYDSAKNLKAGNRKALNEDKRSDADRLFLKTIKPGLSFSDDQVNTAIGKRFKKASRKRPSLRSTNATSTGLINQYPTQGNPKSLVVLVNFSDVKFKPANSLSVYSNMLNQEGFREGFHIGSSRDFFKYNSGGLFTPDFVVTGPVTLNKPMAYYGQNDSVGDDSHPALMVKEACELISANVDFSNFDYDNDGYVDNVYVFYAGKGEADGGGANTIWPHSWAISGENLSLTKNGKNIEKYACSSELTVNGYTTGIGTFTHEYGHVLGLPDMYDTDYALNGEGFNLGDWSLMAYGSYNGYGCVPPCLTLLERKLLDWAIPTELKSSCSMTLPDLGKTNQGYIIKTNNAGEYFLLENRQQNMNSWDAYLLHHGMLIYHIDMRSNATTTALYNGKANGYSFEDLWSMNMVNAISNHQCADIEEADNIPTNIKGDPFPGSGNIKSFTDETTPSMKTWSGASLDKPITAISEKDGIISFDFMGGFFTNPPTALPASETKNYSFKASWNSLLNARSYLLNVYSRNITASGDTVKTYLPGYENKAIEDTVCLINDLDDISTYYYEVRGTNNYMITEYSQTIKVITPKAPFITQFVKDKTVYLKGMNHGSLVKVYDAMGILRYTTTDNKFEIKQKGLYIIEAASEGKKQIIKVLVQ